MTMLSGFLSTRIKLVQGMLRSHAHCLDGLGNAVRAD